jgi:hypothetical protein
LPVSGMFRIVIAAVASSPAAVVPLSRIASYIRRVQFALRKVAGARGHRWREAISSPVTRKDRTAARRRRAKAERADFSFGRLRRSAAPCCRRRRLGGGPGCRRLVCRRHGSGITDLQLQRPALRPDRLAAERPRYRRAARQRQQQPGSGIPPAPAVRPDRSSRAAPGWARSLEQRLALQSRRRADIPCLGQTPLGGCTCRARICRHTRCSERPRPCCGSRGQAREDAARPIGPSSGRGWEAHAPPAVSIVWVVSLEGEAPITRPADFTFEKSSRRSTRRR